MSQKTTRTSISDLLKNEICIFHMHNKTFKQNEEVRQPVSNTEALIHLKSIIRYQEQSADEVFTPNELTVLRRKISVLE
ncbi:4833_t:CDS:1, partial [Paraglomus occultum]